MYCPKGPNGQNNQKCLKSGQCSHQTLDSNGQMSETYLNNCNNNPSVDVILDRTPCGEATLTPHFDQSYETPPYKRWSNEDGFHYLINDGEGINLFQRFLKAEGISQMLDFWFACEGLKTNETQDKQKISKIINVIYKRFIVRKILTDISDEMRSVLKQELTTDSKTTSDYDPKYDRHVFDSAQLVIEDKLKKEIYVNFLRSDIYIIYVNSHSGALRGSSSHPKDNPSSTTDSSMSSMESSTDDYNSESTQYYDVLPTVDEESELQTTESSVNRKTSNTYLRSQTQNKFQSFPVNPCHNLMSSGSNDTLRRGINKILSQRSADNVSTRMTTESHPLSPNYNRMSSAHQSYLRSKSMANPPNPYHVKYATVLPTSARDSEIQSISSHSTNDSMSCVSGPDVTDTNGIRTKKQSLANKHNAKLNSNSNNMTFQLRGAPPGCRDHPPTANDPLNPDKFAQMLIKRLEKVRINNENAEKTEKHMTELIQDVAYYNTKPNKSNPSVRHPSANASESSGCRPNKTINEFIKEKIAENKFEFCPPEDNDQEILDKHFAQVFSETPNETPTDPIGRCVSPPKLHNFRGLDHRMTPPVSASIGGCDSTQVGVTVKYSTEQIPYRLTLTGPHITLRKFKQQIPAKRGNWQYYFKRKCDDRELIDISAAYVLEKISDDNLLLPLIDGKIFAELQESN